jgi:Nucleoside-diphosphate-sugar epimerases
MQNIVVTGADGFLGTNFIKKCIVNGCEVWAIIQPDSMLKSRLKDLKNVHIVPINLENLHDNKNVFPKSVDAFYHFAWQGVHPEDRDNIELQLKNIDLSICTLKFASEIHSKKFIFPGSTLEYVYYGKPIGENATPTPNNAYAATKVATKYLLQNIASKLNIDFIYSVIASIYATDRQDNNVIFYTIDKLLNHQKPSLTKLEQYWDYVYIDDVTEALFLLGKFGKDGIQYTIGKGDNWQLKKYIEIICKIIDPTAKIGIGDIPYKDQRLPSSCVDLTALQRDTGFIPKMEFYDGIKMVIERLKLRDN